jgi:hypothetical protein
MDCALKWLLGSKSGLDRISEVAAEDLAMTYPRGMASHDSIPPIPTLTEIRLPTSWVWLYCGGRRPDGLDCHHNAAVALAARSSRGFDASNDVLRPAAACVRQKVQRCVSRRTIQ